MFVVVSSRHALNLVESNNNLKNRTCKQTMIRVIISNILRNKFIKSLMKSGRKWITVLLNLNWTHRNIRNCVRRQPMALWFYVIIAVPVEALPRPGFIFYLACLHFKNINILHTYSSLIILHYSSLYLSSGCYFQLK